MKILCGDKLCGKGRFSHGSYLCPHNNLSVLYPDLCQEWDYDKNLKQPYQYTPGSGELVWWICKLNPCGYHRWKTTIKNRAINGSSCPYCIKRFSKVCPHNNLQVLYPKLCQEWDYQLNSKTPDQYSYGSGEKVWWQCLNDPCGCHKWQCTINHRTKNKSSCPYCYSSKVCPHNNLQILHPELCREWDYNRNERSPD